MEKEQINSVRESVEILNSSGVYHRTLHWRNLMIGNDGKMYIVDFGASHIPGDEGVPYPDKETVNVTGRDFHKDNEYMLNMLTRFEGLSKDDLSRPLQEQLRDIDPGTVSALGNFRIQFLNAEKSLTVDKIKAILNVHILQHIGRQQDLIQNEAYALLSMAEWYGDSKKAVQVYLNERLQQNHSDKNKHLFELVSNEIS